ncbi:MAG: hypothetical protein R3E79_59195 [Caldilineaceae bacterium]
MDYAISTFIPVYQQAVAINKKHLDPVFLGETTAAEACVALAEELNPILEKAAA